MGEISPKKAVRRVLCVFSDIGIDFFLNIKHMSYVSSGNKRIFYDEFVSMKKIISFFLWFFVFGCFYSDFRHFIINGKNKK